MLKAALISAVFCIIQAAIVVPVQKPSASLDITLQDDGVLNHTGLLQSSASGFFDDGSTGKRQLPISQFNPFLRTDTQQFSNPFGSPQFGGQFGDQFGTSQFGLQQFGQQSQFGAQQLPGQFGTSQFGNQFGINNPSQFSGASQFGAQANRPNCLGYQPGMYGSPTYECRVYYVCQSDGRLDPMQCGVGTKFNNFLGICDWPHKVDNNCNPLYMDTYFDRFGHSAGQFSSFNPSSISSFNQYSSQFSNPYQQQFQTPRYPQSYGRF